VGDWGLAEFSSSGSVAPGPPDTHNSVPVFINETLYAFSHDLGTIQATQAPNVWAIGYTTDPAINYANQSASSSQQRRPYYKSQYTDDGSLVILSIVGEVLVLISWFRSLTF
jgi:hypothetical protein